ncbi:MAG TPA: hypothetical protein VK663_10525 [Burkholderiales bacterium]|nr:hypothetical protein [Burkholderiales bacterium]
MAVAVLLKALALWIAILVLAIINGTLREKALIPAMGAFGGLIASGIALSVCIVLVAFLGAPWYGPLPSSQYRLIGLFWLLLTVLFEFSFGRFVQHKDWEQLVQAYAFKGGNLWPVVLAVTALSPLASRTPKRVGIAMLAPPTHGCGRLRRTISTMNDRFQL